MPKIQSAPPFRNLTGQLPDEGLPDSPTLPSFSKMAQEKPINFSRPMKPSSEGIAISEQGKPAKPATSWQLSQGVAVPAKKKFVYSLWPKQPRQEPVTVSKQNPPLKFQDFTHDQLLNTVPESSKKEPQS